MLRRCGLIGLLLLLSACATPVAHPPETHVTPQEWTGRISLQVQSEPPQQMNASFALQGSAHAGQFDVFSPLGTTLASLQWNPKEAMLYQSDQPQRFASMAVLTESVVGAPLPLAEIFDWLQGRATPAAGWQPDVSQLSTGWVFATRTSPTPTVLLKIKLDTP